jgi:cystathionine beta-lyase family protein involved in aluminum resistance
MPNLRTVDVFLEESAMLGRPRARTSAVLCALLMSSVRSFGSDAIGALHPVCGFPYQYLLDITNYRGHRLKEPIRFQVMGESGLQLYPDQWVDSPRNDDARSSRIKVVHLYRHWWRTIEMSGNFEIVFTYDRKLEGSFKAKYVKPPGGPLICE